MSSRLLKTELNMPLALTLSVIPDIDILIPFIEHRGQTHSIITALIIFAPIFAIYHKKATPYFIALIQHFLIGDYIAGGGIQLLWPITTQRFGISLSIKSTINITAEWMTFLASSIILLKTKDLTKLLQPHNSNLILTIPTFTVLLPTFLSFPLHVPAPL
ncbi:MAG: metal-dependent hydrolase, partial [Candidatus Bathyarchaeia archaeon]